MYEGLTLFKLRFSGQPFNQSMSLKLTGLSREGGAGTNSPGPNPFSGPQENRSMHSSSASVRKKL